MVPADSPDDNRIADTVTIRDATVNDVPAITKIFNHAIAHTTASFYRDPRTIEQRTNWLTNRSDRYAVLVADNGSQVVGWAALDPWTEKWGYRISTEVSYYVDPDFHGQGIGTLLVDRIIQVARTKDFCNVLAKICDNNEYSLKVADRFGFECVGTLKSIGEKFGQVYDVHFYQKQL